LGEDEALELLAEVLNHVVTLGLSVDEEIEVDLLLEADNGLDLLLDELFILSLRDRALSELSTGLTNFLGLLNKERDIRILWGQVKEKRRTGKEPMVVVGNLGRLRCFA